MALDYLETGDIVRYADLSSYMVGYLCRYRILRPTLSTVRRRGVRRRFSFEDLLLARAIAKLLSAKVELSSVRSALRTLRSKMTGVPPSVLATKQIVILGKSVYLTRLGESAVELTADGQLAFHFMLDTTDARARTRESGRTRNVVRTAQRARRNAR
jgi:hypothetical protein